MTADLGAPDLEAVQRRTVRTLVVAQAIGAMGITIGIVAAPLLALELTGEERYAGLVQTFQVLGTALAAYVLAQVMAARGRRVGLVLGLAVGAAGAALAVGAGIMGSLLVLLAGAVLLGATSAANAGARYAATDLAEGRHRASALSLVVWATTVGAVAGPNLSGPAGDLAQGLGIPRLTGPFLLASATLVLAAVVVLVLLRPDPLLLARASGGVHEASHTGTSWGRAVAVARERPVVAAAITGMSLAHAVMIGVMVMTPLHMEHGGSGLEVIGFVVSVHVLGMFAFSPLVGAASDRWGRGWVLLTGGVVLLVSLVVSGRSAAGSPPSIFLGLFLLGLGWSCVTVSASTVVADNSPLAVRTDIQGMSDVLMSLTAAAAGGLSGVVMDVWGYPALNLGAAVLVCGVVASAYVVLADRGAVPEVGGDTPEA